MKKNNKHMINYLEWNYYLIINYKTHINMTFLLKVLWLIKISNYMIIYINHHKKYLIDVILPIKMMKIMKLKKIKLQDN